MRVSHVYLACCLLTLAATLAAQDREQQLFNRLARGKEQVRPEEMVSFKSDYPYTKAIQDLSDMAKKFTGKIIVDTSPIKSDETKTIGTNIESMYWRDALEVILRTNGNWYEEDPEYFLVFSMKEGKKEAGPAGAIPTGQSQGAVQGAATQATQQPPVDSAKVFAQTREVTVSAILLQINQSKLNQHGLNFSISRGNDVNLKFNFNTLGTDQNQIAQLPFTVQANPTPGKMSLDLSAALAFFETEGYGEVVSRPVIRVRDGASSNIQIGQSIPFLTKDFQGNTLQQFIEAGTILKVSPKIYTYNGIHFVDLKYDLDKSTPGASATGGLEVDHNKVSGSLLLLNGERTYVSGLISSTQTTNRSGIPLLKDLPWWVFGLRYIFGYDQVNLVKQELIIIFEAKIEEPVEQRAATNAIGTQKSEMEKARLLREDTDKMLKKNP